MPQAAKEVAPIGTTYQILVDKLGHDNDDWIAGKQVLDRDFPTVDFVRLASIGAVAPVRTDGSVILPPDVMPPKPAQLPHDVNDANPPSEVSGG